MSTNSTAYPARGSCSQFRSEQRCDTCGLKSVPGVYSGGYALTFDHAGAEVNRADSPAARGVSGEASWRRDSAIFGSRSVWLRVIPGLRSSECDSNPAFLRSGPVGW